VGSHLVPIIHRTAKPIAEDTKSAIDASGVLAEKTDYVFGRHILLANVPSQESPLASGMASAREAELAEAMPEVPKGR